MNRASPGRRSFFCELLTRHRSALSSFPPISSPRHPCPVPVVSSVARPSRPDLQITMRAHGVPPRWHLRPQGMVCAVLEHSAIPAQSSLHPDHGDLSAEKVTSHIWNVIFYTFMLVIDGMELLAGITGILKGSNRRGRTMAGSPGSPSGVQWMRKTERDPNRTTSTWNCQPIACRA